MAVVEDFKIFMIFLSKRLGTAFTHYVLKKMHCSHVIDAGIARHRPVISFVAQERCAARDRGR